MKIILKLLKYILSIIVFATIFSVITVTAFFFIINPELPSIENAESYQLDTPLKVLSKNGKIIAYFGQSKREPLTFDKIPTMMINAIVSAEDNRFYQHPGVDYQGLIRAAINLIMTGKKGQGGSTITMQVARNFFLSRKKTYTRKIREIFLALKLEHHFSKEKILELYLNKIYLGHRSYGIATAAKTYYGKPLQELSVDQYAMLAGLPKAPSKYNPITNRSRATLRRDYVLGRMYDLNYINKETYIEAKSVVDSAKLHTPKIELNAPYIAEMTRSWLINNPQFTEDVYTAGYKVYTTIDGHLQNTATKALRTNLMRYEHRHGYKGPIKQIEVDKQSLTLIKDSIHLSSSYKDLLVKHLSKVHEYGQLKSAIVLHIEENKKLNSKKLIPGFAWILLKSKLLIKLPWQHIKWAKKYISDTRYGKQPITIASILSVGDVIYVEDKPLNDQISYQLAQLPEVSSAIVSLKPRTGEIVALGGGFDFYQSKFNRITQAKRQPGSNFKPFIYSAALNKGYTTASMINDAPVVFKDKNLEGSWRPSNYSGKFFGPTRLRKALYKSRNMVSIRILMDIGVNYALNYVSNFGFNQKELPHNLSLSLGSANLTPLQIVQGYAVFANGGYPIEPWFIDKILDRDNKVVYQHIPVVACSNYYDKSLCPEDPSLQAPRSIDEDNVFLMSSILYDVIKLGTGRKALSLKRKDIGGKTGTTNEQVDAWFSGYNRDFVTTAWTGFDTPRSMGRYETGGKAALPLWIDFMSEALKQSKEQKLPISNNIVSVKIDEKTGKLSRNQNDKTLFEYFIKNTEPKEDTSTKQENNTQQNIEDLEEELF